MMAEAQHIQKVGVIGSGTMGHGIAHACALAGLDVVLHDVDAPRLEHALTQIGKNLRKAVEIGKLDAHLVDPALARITTSTDFSSVAQERDLIIEAVPERLELKQQLFRQLDEIAPTQAILGSNTSSLPIGEIASVVSDPSRVIGLHFFNPVHINKLLEIVIHDGTSAACLASAKTFGEAIGKSCITVKDSPGFASSRLGLCLGMEAIRMVQDGVASAEDIDTAMTLGYRHPMGPLKLTDLVGLDVRMHIGEHLAQALNNPAFEPPELMRQMVADGKLGKKSGQGFYKWA
jgi:3-hydroxybutyryl-CoA dehydrogenase